MLFQPISLPRLFSKMKFSAIIASALLAGTSVASPVARSPLTRPRTRRPDIFTNDTATQYSPNWAGAVLIGNSYTVVSGEFTVPTPSAPPGASPYQQYCASAWVGIDGDTCQSAILQTGVNFCIQGGQPSFQAWYEWYPDYMYYFQGISISAGDNMRVTVDASSSESGTATIENLSNGQKVTHNFNGGVQGDLCETNAEWIVEDFESNGSLVPFADFGTVTFSNAYAEQGGQRVGPEGATMVDIQQNGQVLTSSSVSGNGVTVTYE